jgi:hypothetical protein
VRITRSDATSGATVDGAAHAPLSQVVVFPRRDSSRRRSLGHYPDSETAWHARGSVRVCPHGLDLC